MPMEPEPLTKSWAATFCINPDRPAGEGPDR